MDVAQQVSAPHRASVSCLYNERVNQSNLMRVKKRGGHLARQEEMLSDVQWCFLPPAGPEPMARTGGPGAFMVMRPYLCPDALGLPPLGVGCLRFWREGMEQTLGGPLTTSCTLESRPEWIYLRRGPKIYRDSGGNLAGLGLYLEEQTKNDEAKLVLTHD